MDTNERSNGMPDAFDRQLGVLDGLPGVVQTKQSTIQTITPVVGNAETFIVQTIRVPEHGDTIFLQCLGAERAFRLAIPPKVAEVIARQRESIATTLRRRMGKRLAAERKARGIRPPASAFTPEARKKAAATRASKAQARRARRAARKAARKGA